ncbi:hypothetical protein ACU4GA_00495 [Methylobacterium oryzae CBMB20]
MSARPRTTGPAHQETPHEQLRRHPGPFLGPGRTVDTGDQLSSVVLLGIAVAGAAVAVLLNALIV